MEVARRPPLPPRLGTLRPRPRAQRGAAVPAPRAALLADANDALILSSLHQHELTAQARAAEAALRGSELRFRTLVEQVKDYAIFMTDPQGRATSWNEGVGRVLGFEEDEFVGQDIVPLIFTPEDVRNGIARRELEEATLFGTASDDRWMMKKGGTRFFAAGVTTSLHEGDRLIGFTRVLRDQTDGKRAEEGQAQLLAEVQRSNDELRQFARFASHDLREPLRTIASFLTLLARRYQGKIDRDADEYIAYAVAAAKRMDELIKDLLAYTRIAGPVREHHVVDFEVLLTRVVASLGAAIEEAGAEITHDPLPKVPGDPNRLSQVLQNLVANAVKFRGSEPPRIHVSAVQDDRSWRFAVRDNGIGIDPAQSGRLFGIFQRLHTKTPYSGTGIGLAICKRIVEAHGGRIWMESQPGQGATFFFTIPAEAVAGGDVFDLGTP